MKLLAVTGNPVLHSRSPLMFNAAFLHLGMQARYFRLAADTAQEAIDLFLRNGLLGMNVTAPFKQDIMPLLHHIDPAAQRIGSVNTVVQHDGQLYGYNTDHLGVSESLRAHQVPIEGQNCVVLGAGGAARGVVYALLQAGAQVTVLNRSFDKAQALALEFDCQARHIDELKDALSTANIFVSTLAGDICLVNPDWLHAHTVVFDANYKHSTLLGMAQQRGCRCISGLDWLLYQAAPAFQLFFEQQAPISIMRSALETEYSSKKNYNLALIGFMGVGKTTNGSLFAERNNMRFVDTDIAIVKRYKRSVSDIFRLEGEAAFRQKEATTLEYLMRYPNSVIACGGGLIVTPANRDLLRRRALVVWLSASPEQVIARMKPNSRPLLAVENPLERAYQLFDERKGWYAEVADFMVNTEGKTTDQIVQKIYDEIDITFNR